MNDAVCFTITKDLARPNLYKIKKCYIMTIPEVKEKIWKTEIYIRCTYDTSSMEDIIKMCEDNWKIPYIADINRGDVVSEKQLSTIAKYLSKCDGCQEKYLNRWDSYLEV